MVLLLKFIVYDITKLTVLNIYFLCDAFPTEKLQWLYNAYKIKLTFLSLSFYAFIHNLFLIFPALSLVIFLHIAFTMTFLVFLDDTFYFLIYWILSPWNTLPL